MSCDKSTKRPFFLFWGNLTAEPTGVRDLVVYPLSPTAVILSWQRPYNVAFRKYVLQTFYFNSAMQTAQWTTYYEIAATASVIASVVKTIRSSSQSSDLSFHLSIRSA